MADDVWSQTSFAYRVRRRRRLDAAGHRRRRRRRACSTRSADLPDGALVEYRAVTVDAAGHRSAASTYGERRRRRRRRRDPGPDPGEDLFVTVPGSHNTEMGCPGDWQPDCEDGPADQAAPTASTPARSRSRPGSYEYKVAIGGTLGRELRRGRRRRAARTSTYTVAATAGPVTFFYDPTTHYFTSTAQGPILTVPGLAQQRAGLRRRLDAGLPGRRGCRTRTVTARTRSRRDRPARRAPTRSRSRTTSAGPRTTAPAARPAGRTSRSRRPAASP